MTKDNLYKFDSFDENAQIITKICNSIKHQLLSKEITYKNLLQTQMLINSLNGILKFNILQKYDKSSKSNVISEDIRRFIDFIQERYFEPINEKYSEKLNINIALSGKHVFIDDSIMLTGEKLGILHSFCIDDNELIFDIDIDNDYYDKLIEKCYPPSNTLIIG